MSRGNPEAITQGYYVFCPPSTPAYPGRHNLWSRDWTSGDGPSAELGELSDARRRWHNGQPPTPFPLPIVIGKSSDIRRGTCGGMPTVGAPPCAQVVGFLPTLFLTFTHVPPAWAALLGTVYTLSDGHPPTGLWVGQITGGVFDFQGEVQCGEPGHWLFDGGPLSIIGEDADSWSKPLRVRFHQGEEWQFEVRASSAPLPPAQELRDGFPVACYGNPPIRPAIEIQSAPTQLALAQCLTQLYTDPDAATATLQALMGPDAELTTVATNTGLTPATIIGKRSDITVMVIVGTTTFEQLALQIMYAGQGLSQVSGFRTNLVWWANAGVLHDRLGRAGINPALPAVYVGHSYGGALASILAAQVVQFAPERNVQLLTFGSPKPGDAALRDLLRRTREIHYVNGGDPTPALPPSDFWIAPIFALVPAILLADWVAWQQADNQLLLEVDGTITEVGPLPLPLPQLLLAAAAATGALPFPPFADHAMPEYLARLSLAIG